MDCTKANALNRGPDGTFRDDQLRHKSNELIATLARTKTVMSCTSETFTATSLFLKQPATIVATGSWGSSLVRYTWPLAGDGSTLEILKPR
ncbi:hypothetical protein SPRG_02506 [Saprolegnia parasitica CBS 223.65]|uniref:Uncharacterized protein n=1 Tax=Saprolegnia parasitica (strain CBS 223.65) TaxID=695850 RepID=A0A067CQP0_SAPPC|nr:hypothetical protein SPRG_02506 [Saprolegnia parasitica CBS 223.65]KDO32813.1 hypothetical protein SPRG_02506 [Saprolegnia parasitica CBS 223.65]|eukprot:XP_012196469.1 hypothetical protein SPRG_02506 [Saprolegnia parasitica CBS 223.65]